MVNRNGSNNGHNGVHEDTAIATVNGNGHKPDASIPAEHDPVSSAGQTLYWDGLSPAVTQSLGQPLDPELASQRKGRKGQFYDYLEGHAVIAQANRIFGYGGWGYELAGDVTLRRVETVDPQTGEVKVEQGYSAPVRVTVAGALPRTDIGVHPVVEDTFDGHDTAMKGAVTDGMKRAFRSFGVQFGNGFYGDQSPGQRRGSAAARARQVPGSGQRQLREGPIQWQRQACPGAAQGQQRLPGRQAAQAALRDRLGAGHRRRQGAGSRDGAHRQEHRRPDGRRARAVGGGRGQQAPADEAGPGATGRLVRPDRPAQRSGAVSFVGRPAPSLQEREDRPMTTMTATYTPWGWTHDVEELAEGILRATTPSHGGLKLSRERWDELPAAVCDTMLTPTFAEEDCEEPIVRLLLGVGDDRDREMALIVADYFDRYAPALPFIRHYPPGLHYHVLFYWGGYGSDPFERFDTLVEAESFAGDPEMVTKYGRMEAIHCSRTRPLCLPEGGRP